MTNSEIMAKILEISENSYFRWKKKDHVKLITLIEKYFTSDELKEFLDTNRILNFENINYIQNSFIVENKNRYVLDFRNINLLFKNINLDYYISDFYFYFLSNLKNKTNFFSSTDYEYESSYVEKYDFSKALSDYIFEKQSIELQNDNFEKSLIEIKNELERIHKADIESIESIEKYFKKDNENNATLSTFKNFNFDEKKERQNLTQKIIDNSKNKFEHIYKNLYFIQNWDNDMYFFISYLIKTNFELFINLNDKELLFHAIGFFVYSENHKYDNIKDKLSIVQEVYQYFNENKDELNKDILKEISLNYNKLDDLKKYKRINNYFKSIKKDLSKEEINKIILDPIKFERINIQIQEFENENSHKELIQSLSEFPEKYEKKEKLEKELLKNIEQYKKIKNQLELLEK